jgi:hypothetical protein
MQIDDLILVSSMTTAGALRAKATYVDVSERSMTRRDLAGRPQLDRHDRPLRRRHQGRLSV